MEIININVWNANTPNVSVITIPKPLRENTGLYTDLFNIREKIAQVYGKKSNDIDMMFACAPSGGLYSRLDDVFLDEVIKYIDFSIEVVWKTRSSQIDGRSSQR
jgi:hypothetical protein